MFNTLIGLADLKLKIDIHTMMFIAMMAAKYIAIVGKYIAIKKLFIMYENIFPKDAWYEVIMKIIIPTVIRK